ncbi:uncharacterized protein G2W53_030979 [Senna tora]|uniref:Uncharacterized protein n=1 Tax=Senna tora TaxID=362788 RepID=A0A834WBA7_9FABA|nr:uncharacterized protein G2W53_030979 [Senna tora]
MPESQLCYDDLHRKIWKPNDVHARKLITKF